MQDVVAFVANTYCRNTRMDFGRWRFASPLKDFNHFMSPLRTMDLSMIHVCLLAYTHAVSDDNAIFELLGPFRIPPLAGVGTALYSMIHSRAEGVLTMGLKHEGLHIEALN